MKETEFRMRAVERNIDVAKQTKDALAVFSRQQQEDQFQDFYDRGLILRPPYDFAFLRSLWEESDTLQADVSAMVKNVAGMGFIINYLGDDNADIPADAKQEKIIVDDFFGQPNEKDSWLDITCGTWEDYEVLGNGALEVVRDLSGEVCYIYHHPTDNMRLIALHESDFITVPLITKRGGREVVVDTTCEFRRFVSRTPFGILRYYKTFGDPRELNTDGTYGPRPGVDSASEIIWISNKKGLNQYGLPKWIGCTFDVAGRRDAQALNWSLLRNQGVAPMAILVEGKLTDGSWSEINNMIDGARGLENFNRIWVLQVSATPTAVGQKSSTGLKIEDLSGIQKVDQMYTAYLKNTEDRIRMAFRLPAGFVGSTGAYSYGTMRIAKVLGEEQVFAPERIFLDNIINSWILHRGFGIKNWRYKTKAAEAAGPEEIRNAITALSNSGALSIDNAVKLANDALGRDFSEFEQPWSKYPMPLILKILDKQGGLKGIEDVAEPYAPPTTPQQVPVDDLNLMMAEDDLPF